jgi:dTDP-glucose 4,6-dehydratase
MSSKHIVVTGAAGFIGSHLVEHIHRKTDWRITVLDKLTYASNGWTRLRDAGMIDSSRVRTFTVDLAAGPLSEGLVKEIGDVDYIAHLAAESHVDRSVADAPEFVRNNIMSTVYMLEYARQLETLETFLYFSTDEVHKDSNGGKGYEENAFQHPGNPYSASKSASEKICLGYANTFNIPLMITNTVNVYGERQDIEKFVPKCVKYLLEGKIVPIHSNPDRTEAGTRYYIHARMVADAVLFILERGTHGSSYNITTDTEIDNLKMAQFIASVMDKELKYEMIDFHSERPQHDLAYSLRGDKLEEMGWNPGMDVWETLRRTIEWTLEPRNRKWLE